MIGFCPPYTITVLVRQLKAMTFERVVIDGRRRATPPPGQHFSDTLVQSLTDRFFLDQVDVTDEETDTCETVPSYLLASFMDPRFRNLSILADTDRSAKTVKAMPSLPASSDVASPASLETEILLPPKKKSKSEVAIEELLDKGKSSNSSGASTGQVEKNQRFDREIQQLSNGVPVGLTEDPLMWRKENSLVRNLAARVLAAPPKSVPGEQIFSKTGLVVSKKRAALKPAVVDALILLHKNIM